MNLKDFKKELLKNPEFKEEYFKNDLSSEVGQMIMDARIIKGITQKELADKIKTKQPSIARIESGSILPSLGFLKKIAGAFNTYLISPKFGFMEEMNYDNIRAFSKNSTNTSIVKGDIFSFTNNMAITFIPYGVQTTSAIFKQ